MSGGVTSSDRSEGRGGVLSRRARRLVSGVVVVFLGSVVLCVFVWRPAARLNRLFSSVGLGELPSSAHGLRVERQGRGFGSRTVYARFEADIDAIARFVDGSAMTVGTEPVPMATISFGPRCPAWMTWERTVEGRTYHDDVDGASVWLMVDDQGGIVYVGVFEFRPGWLRWLRQ